MGKKTNWTVSEDQALCRAWFTASDASLGHGSDQKAGTFWGVVHQLFHAELETSVDRPVTGLKIRWTRINRDVQKFALGFARVVASRTAGDATEMDGERERQYIDEAAELYVKEQGGKFAFESCWKLLRFSPRWTQLLASTAGVSLSSFQNQSFMLSMDNLGRLESATAASSAEAGPPIGMAASTLASQKRRLASFMDSQARSSPSYLQGSTQAIVEELQRQSTLLEEQNAISLFRMELDLIEDDVARQYFSDLRQTYVKRMRQETTPTPPRGSGEEEEEEEDGEDKQEQAETGKQTADL